MDFDDAIQILRKIGKQNKAGTLSQALKFKNFTPHTDDFRSDSSEHGETRLENECLAA